MNIYLVIHGPTKNSTNTKPSSSSSAFLFVEKTYDFSLGDWPRQTVLRPRKFFVDRSDNTAQQKRVSIHQMYCKSISFRYICMLDTTKTNRSVKCFSMLGTF